MEPRNQQTIDQLAAQELKSSEESKNECRTQQPYRAPELHFAGKANHLITGHVSGNYIDAINWYFWW